LPLAGLNLLGVNAELAPYLREEAAAAESRAVAVRLLAIVFLALIQLALLAFGIEEAVIVAFSTVLSVLAAVAGAGLWLLLRRGYQPWFGYLNVTFDVLLVWLVTVGSAFVLGGGAHYAEATKSPFSLVFFLVVALAGLRQSPRLALFAGVLAGLAEMSLLFPVWVVRPDLVTFVTAADFHGPSVSPIRLVTIALILVLSGLVARATANRSRGLVRRVATEQVAVAEEKAAQAALINAFERYFPQREALQLLAAGGLPKGGERVEVTVMTADIRGFTSISERLAPDRIVEVLNRYFEAMVEIIFANDGTLISFVGDGLWAVFGLPAARPGDADRAVAAARAMGRRLAELNAEGAFAEVGGLRIGIAVHSGEVLAGTIGSDRRQEYTVIGDTVNTAARLEEANKELHTELLVSEATVSRLTSPDGLTPKGEIPIRGRKATLAIYSD
jgi:adenylate cyclase